MAFQSTRPLRGATWSGCASCFPKGFQSTRPLRGATSARWRRKRPRKHFNPRAPCGARPTFLASHRWLIPFQSTRPLRGATMTLGEGKKKVYISIHAPLAGRDSKSAQKNAALLRKRYKYKLFVCKKCTSGNLTGAYSSKNTLYSGAKRSENPCALSVRTQRISGPSTSNPGLMPKCSILERYFSPR